MDVSKEELAQRFMVWRDDPVTSAIFYLMQGDIDAAMGRWSRGNFGDNISAQAAAIGGIHAYRTLLQMNPDDFSNRMLEIKEPQ
jgi:hypothetical protein